MHRDNVCYTLIYIFNNICEGMDTYISVQVNQTRNRIIPHILCDLGLKEHFVYVRLVVPTSAMYNMSTLYGNTHRKEQAGCHYQLSSVAFHAMSVLFNEYQNDHHNKKTRQIKIMLRLIRLLIMRISGTHFTRNNLILYVYKIKHDMISKPNPLTDIKVVPFILNSA